MLDLILPISQFFFILMHLLLIYGLRSRTKAYERGWRDGQFRLVSLCQEYAERPDVHPDVVFWAAAKSALQEDPEIGKTHLPWWSNKELNDEPDKPT